MTLLLRFRRNCAASDRVTYVTCCARFWALQRSAGVMQRIQTRPARRREDVWCRNEGIEILLLYHRMAFLAASSPSSFQRDLTVDLHPTVLLLKHFTHS